MISASREFDPGKFPMRFGHASNPSCRRAPRAPSADGNIGDGLTAAENPLRRVRFLPPSCLCYGLSVEGATQKLWQRQRHSSLFSAKAAARARRGYWSLRISIQHSANHGRWISVCRGFLAAIVRIADSKVHFADFHESAGWVRCEQYFDRFKRSVWVR